MRDQLSPLAGDYDLILIDCPPGNRPLQQQALSAAHYALIPTPSDDASLHETGARTFGINELMMRPAWRRRGYASALSTALLDGLSVERVTLLVRAESTAAYTTYRSWGFQTIGRMQPFDDSPLYEAMVREVRDKPT